MVNSRFRALATLALIAMGAALASLGRIGLDWLISIAPNWTNIIERFGGSGLGAVIGLTVILPLARIYGLFKDQSSSQRSEAVPED